MKFGWWGGGGGGHVVAARKQERMRLGLGLGLGHSLLPASKLSGALWREGGKSLEGELATARREFE